MRGGAPYEAHVACQGLLREVAKWPGMGTLQARNCFWPSKQEKGNQPSSDLELRPLASPESQPPPQRLPQPQATLQMSPIHTSTSPHGLSNRTSRSSFYLKCGNCAEDSPCLLRLTWSLSSRPGRKCWGLGSKACSCSL